MLLNEIQEEQMFIVHFSMETKVVGLTFWSLSKQSIFRVLKSYIGLTG